MLDQRLKKYIENNYYERIYDSISSLLDSNEKLDDFLIAKLFVFDKFNLDFKCEIKIEAYIKNLDYSNVNQKDVRFIVEFEGKFTCNSINCYGFKARFDYGDFHIKDKYMDNAFVPYISEEKYEEIAKAFLDKYYPEYKSDQPINIPTLLDRLGLNIEYRNLSNDRKIFGIICIDDCNIDTYDDTLTKHEIERANAGTIFIDKNAHYYFASGKSSAKYTIIHECIHWFLHRKYFLFNKNYNDGKKAVVCSTTGEIMNFVQNEEIKWIEKQANRVTSKILMPRDFVLKKYVDFFRECESNLKCEKICYAIRSLATFYGVSILVVKNRLFELGNKEIVGAFEYIDDNYVNAYYYQHEGDENISFSISNYDLTMEFLKNNEFRKIISSGNYLYVENHLCVNNSKYIYNDKKRLGLTPYARENISVCCIPFEYTYKSNNYTFEKKDYAFCRKNMASERIEVSIKLSDKYNISSNAAEKCQKQIIKETNEELKKLPNSFNETLKMLIKNRDVTLEELSADSGIDEKTIRRIKDGETSNPNIKTLVAICIGLKLHPCLSRDLIKKSNYNLDAISEENIAYNTILDTMYNKSIDEVNEYLESISQEKITKNLDI